MGGELDILTLECLRGRPNGLNTGLTVNGTIVL